MDYMRITFTVEKALSHKIIHSLSSDHERLLMHCMYYLFMCSRLLWNQGIVSPFGGHVWMLEFWFLKR